MATPGQPDFLTPQQSAEPNGDTATGGSHLMAIDSSGTFFRSHSLDKKPATQTATVNHSSTSPTPFASGHARRSMMASRRVADSSNLNSPKPGTATGFFSNLMSTTVPVDKLPKLPPPLRIAVVGAAKSGKTQMIQRFITGQYDRSYTPTNKIELSLKLLQTTLGHSYALEIWDIPANPKMEDLLRDTYAPQMDGAIIVTDSTDLKSFSVIRKWADLFSEIQLARLAENLSALGVNDEDSSSVQGQLAHSLPGPDGRPLLVSTFPVLLFANKSDSDRSSLSRQDILESASHFKLSFGVLGSALLNKPLNVPPIVPTGNLGPSLLAKVGELNRLNVADSGVDQAFQLLLSELVKFQHLRATTALARAHLGPQGASVIRTELPLPSGTLLENSLHSLAQNSRASMFQQGGLGLASRKFAASHGAAAPLPTSLASLKTGGGKTPSATGRSSAFNFGARAGLKITTPTNAATTVAPKSNMLATAAALNQARAAKIAAEAAEEEQEDGGLDSGSRRHRQRRRRARLIDDEDDLDSAASGTSSAEADDGDEPVPEEPTEEENLGLASHSRVRSMVESQPAAPPPPMTVASPPIQEEEQQQRQQQQHQQVAEEEQPQSSQSPLGEDGAHDEPMPAAAAQEEDGSLAQHQEQQEVAPEVHEDQQPEQQAAIEEEQPAPAEEVVHAVAEAVEAESEPQPTEEVAVAQEEQQQQQQPEEEAEVVAESEGVANEQAQDEPQPEEQLQVRQEEDGSSAPPSEEQPPPAASSGEEIVQKAAAVEDEVVPAAEEEQGGDQVASEEVAEEPQPQVVQEEEEEPAVAQESEEQQPTEEVVDEQLAQEEQSPVDEAAAHPIAEVEEAPAAASSHHIEHEQSQGQETRVEEGTVGEE